MIQITPQIAAMLMLAFLSMMLGFGKLLLSQIQKQLDERAKHQEELREAQMDALGKALATEAGRINAISTAMERFTSEFVRREDYIRFNAVIDHKLDRLHDLFLSIRNNP